MKNGFKSCYSMEFIPFAIYEARFMSVITNLTLVNKQKTEKLHGRLIIHT